MTSAACARRFSCAAMLVAVAIGVAGVGQADTVRVRIAEAASRLDLRDAADRSFEVRVAGSALKVSGRKLGVRHTFSAGDGPYRLRGIGGRAFHLRGAVSVERRGIGFDVINHVDLEDYVAGTLGGEMISSWAPAALRAQTVAIRSYVLYQRAKRTAEPFDVTGDVSSQRYLGIEGESEAAWEAVRATRGEVLQDGAGPVLAAFHSASGGQTASAAEVWGTPIAYLRSVPVDYEDASPDTYWRVAVSQRNLRRALEELGVEIGSIEAIDVTRRSASGRAAEVRFRGKAGRAKVTGRQLRQALGSSAIRSTMFDVRFGDGEAGEEGAEGGEGEQSTEAIFVGSGYGHGVGMSQWAAQGMALEGATYDDILNKFYPGTRLAPFIETASRATGHEATPPRVRRPAASRDERTIRSSGATRPKHDGTRRTDRMGDRRP